MGTGDTLLAEIIARANKRADLARMTAERDALLVVARAVECIVTPCQCAVEKGCPHRRAPRHERARRRRARPLGDGSARSIAGRRPLVEGEKVP